jgi:hypothetical protein
VKDRKLYKIKKKKRPIKKTMLNLSLYVVILGCLGFALLVLKIQPVFTFGALAYNKLWLNYIFGFL